MRWVGIHLFAAGVVLSLLPGTGVVSAESGKTATGCSAMGQPLAFWLGRWDVFVDGKLDGKNFIEATLDGCATLEHWDDVSGMKGLSVFYFEPHSHQWKQVWITDHAELPGGLKEKTMISARPDEVRFQGIVWASADRMVLDRTTLKKIDKDQVRQVIERSTDGGETWIVGFDAIYRRRAD